MPGLNELKHHLDKSLPCQDKWVAKPSHYEDDFAKWINHDKGAKAEKKGGLYDCVWNGLRLELKKQMQQAWVNLIPYSKLLLKPNNDGYRIVTLFIFYEKNDKNPKKGKILQIYGLKMKTLIDILGLDGKVARNVLKVNDEVFKNKNEILKKKINANDDVLKENTLNVQCGLTKRMIRTVADFSSP